MRLTGSRACRSAGWDACMQELWGARMLELWGGRGDRRPSRLAYLSTLLAPRPIAQQGTLFYRFKSKNTVRFHGCSQRTKDKGRRKRKEGERWGTGAPPPPPSSPPSPPSLPPPFKKGKNYPHPTPPPPQISKKYPRYIHLGPPPQRYPRQISG